VENHRARPVGDVTAQHGLLEQKQSRLGAKDLLFQINDLLFERLHARLKRFISRLRRTFRSWSRRRHGSGRRICRQHQDQHPLREHH